jgi:Asp-tRNA(Asn)/Glu-tRNA(Gln) amidotransferase A subunit family amidase
MSGAGGTVERRAFLGLCAAVGAGSGVFPGLLLAGVEDAVALDGEITEETILHAERLAGLAFTPEQRQMLLQGVRTNVERYHSVRSLELPNAVPPALHFDPLLPGETPPAPSGGTVTVSRPTELPDPADPVALAYASVAELGALLRQGRVSSEALTRLFLDRLERHDEALECVVTLLPERALAQARRADAELAAGVDRGPLHGIPWGAKDLLAVAGAPTTWGAVPYQEQVLDEDATVVRRLDESGAVLVAKLTLGALAQGDVWFGGRTRNPWNLEQGSSGSSAGSASAVAAGLVPFAIGSETLGSIVSPATRCAVSGLRPTFGAVSRHGAMALSWSMDKLGPMARNVEDLALVFEAIRGPDGLDSTVVAADFQWEGPGAALPPGLRVGVLEGAFDGEGDEAELNREALQALLSLGVDPVPVTLPRDLPTAALRTILVAEAAAAFDELTTSGRDALLVSQGGGAWPNTFRTARFIPAVEYIQANRVRTLLMRRMAEALRELDVVVAPSYAQDLLLATNLTGHPVVVVPSGFRGNGAAISLSFLGQLHGEGAALALARSWQRATGHHLARPPQFG